jgi:Putative bacterial sensory transduction regulator
VKRQTKAWPIFILAVLGALPAPAQAPVRWNPRAPENNQVLATFNYANIEQVLDAIGARHRRGGTTPNRPVILVNFANGRRAVLVLNACDSGGTVCKAMSIQSYWTRIGNSPPERTAEAIASFNRRLAFAKAFVAADGRPTLQRYLTADYGFIRGNLAVNLLVFANQAERFAADVLAPLESGRVPASEA